MTELRRFSIGIALAAVLLLFGSACGGGSDDVVGEADGSTETVASGSEGSEDGEASAPADGDAPAGEEEDSAETEAPSEDEDETDDESGDGEPESLDDYLGSGLAGLFTRGPGSGVNAEAIGEEQRQIEQRTKECMALQGFEYESDSSGGAGFATFFEAVGENADLSPEDYAAQEGFGISTLYDKILAGVDAAIDAGADNDPNQSMLDEMSQAERDAWFITLDGQLFETDEEGRRLDPDTGEPLEGLGAFTPDSGCRFEAQGAVRADFQAINELSDEFEELDNRIEADGRVSEIQREWSECMGAGGWFYAEEQEVRDEIQAEFVPFALPLLAGAQAGNIPQLDNERETALADLQSREREIAVASWDCQKDNVDELDEIRARYEAEFIEANRSALEAIRGG